MAKKSMPFGGKQAMPFGGKEKGKEEKMEKKGCMHKVKKEYPSGRSKKKMGKKAYMAGEMKEKKAGVSKMGAYKKGGMVKGKC